jgi:2'-5' RNA ligase
MARRRRVLVALVVRGRLGTEIDGLRRALGSTEIDRIAPHVTLVPPTNVSDDDLDELLGSLRATAAATLPVTLDLGPPGTFDRAEPVIFLAVHAADGTLATLASRCAAVLAPRGEARDVHPFVPHVTLVNRSTPRVRDAALLAFADFRATTVAREAVLFERDDRPPERRWREIADFAFGPEVVRGRGGLEVTLAHSRYLDPVVAARVDAVPGAAGASSTGRPWAVVARTGGVAVAVGAGGITPAECVIATLWVDPRFRSHGHATRVLAEVEALTRTAGVERIAVEAEDPEVRRFLEGRGFVPLDRPGGRSRLERLLSVGPEA